ncbi:MerR family transcriptional regulator [Streptosporangiaceae bacterium NEAU-GS5]|nr:MerR family transcriptional regulator [Streptosporangiaceae bacterium NEAU-GS5]
MRISQLSAESGVPIPTIKYYLREGLLPPGEATSATRAEYGERHLRRLRLIRALLEIGRLPVASIRKVLAAVEDEETPLHRMLGTVHYAIGPDVEPHPDTAEWQQARADVDALIDQLGWAVSPNAPTRDELAQTLFTLRSLGAEAGRESLIPYARLAEQLVREREMATIPLDGPRDAAAEALVIGTVLYGKAFDVLRRIAHEAESARLLNAHPEH